MMSLVVDLRRAFDSGLGTYIRAVVPPTLDRLAARLPEPLHVVGLISPGSEARHRSYLADKRIAMQTCPAKPLTVREQWTVRRLLPNHSLLWATTLAHPLFASAKLVATVHDVLQVSLRPPAGPGPVVRGMSRVYFESLRRNADVLLFNSAFSLAEFRAHVGQPKGRCVVTPLGVDPQRFGRRDAAPQRPYFVALGNIRPHKNLSLLLQAFELVSQELPHDLWLIGRQQRPLPLHVPELLRRRVKFLGEVDDQAVPLLLQQACALVLPSLYEGFGLPALEAMACGCLVLASKAGALPETCGGAALMFDPHDVEGLADVLRRAVRMTSEERASWRNAGFSRAQAMPWQRTADQTADALREALMGISSAAGAAAAIQP